MSSTPFKRLIFRAVLRDVYPMVIRLVAMPDHLTLADFDESFHAVLGWDGGIGYAFQVHGQEFNKFNSFRRHTQFRKLRDFQLHRQERFLYTPGALDQWEWELRVVDLQDGAAGDEIPVCVGGRGSDTTTILWRPNRISADVQAPGTGEKMCPPEEVETVIGMLAAAHTRRAGEHRGTAAQCGGGRMPEPGSAPATLWPAGAGAVQLTRGQRATGRIAEMREVRVKFRVEVVCISDAGQEHRSDPLEMDRRQLAMETQAARGFRTPTARTVSGGAAASLPCGAVSLLGRYP